MRHAPRAGLAYSWRALATLAVLAIACAPPSASAQKWPDRSITLIVPFAAGGASDVSSRIMAEAMAKQLGQTIVVENVAGAGGATGSLRGKNAARVYSDPVQQPEEETTTPALAAAAVPLSGDEAEVPATIQPRLNGNGNGAGSVLVA